MGALREEGDRYWEEGRTVRQRAVGDLICFVLRCLRGAAPRRCVCVE